MEPIPKSRSQFGLEAEIRLHEVGIASNRESAGRGEYVPGPCTHRPSHQPSRVYPKLRLRRIEGMLDKEGEVVTR